MNSPLISRPAALTLNHLLRQNPAACASLRVHYRKQITFDFEVLALHFVIRADGMLQQIDAQAFSRESLQVCLKIRASDLPILLQDRSQAMRYVRISGDAHLAQDLAHCANFVKWDAESDLAHLVGDIAAVRLASGVRIGAKALQASVQRSAENFGTLMVEKYALLVRPKVLDNFSDEVTRIRDDVERLAKRIERLS